MDGKEDLLEEAPTGLLVQQYAEARTKELLAMYKSANTVIGNTQPIQRLPRHMRRRAASHNVKRLPRKLHSLALREMSKAGTPTKPRRPSRKYRRRPHNLLEEYNRRRRRFVWLETHIWHAKRFHMTEKWGYKIPLHPNDKGTRAAYRATTKYCLLQDLSYHCCIQLEGKRSSILQVLSQISSQDTGLSFGARAYINGQREGRTLLYRRWSFPYGALGEVKFMWKFIKDTNDNSISQPDLPTQLWLWTHPAMYTDVMAELKVTISDVNIPHNTDTGSEDQDSEKNDQISNKHTMESKPQTSRVDRKCTKTLQESEHISSEHVEITPDGDIRIPSSKLDIVREESFSARGVTVTSLKDTLCRFHLTGPLSNEVLLDALRVADVTSQDTPVDESDQKRCWWKSEFNVNCCKGQINQENHKKQSQFFDSIKFLESPGELPPNCIVGLTVKDPRLFLPRKKTLITYEKKKSGSTMNICTPPLEVSQSLLWDKEIRMNVKDTKMADKVINSERSKALLPGSELDLGEAESRVPVMLVQNPGRRPSPQEEWVCRGQGTLVRPGYCSGWDLLVPGGWGMPFLLALVYRGARVAGLKEIHTLAVEQGLFCYPNIYPDTPAGKEWEKSTWQEKQKKYDRIPPAKKSNFSKMGVVAPYHFPWSELLQEWSQITKLNKSSSGNNKQATVNQGDFYVLRSRTHLKKLQKICFQRLCPIKKCPPPVKKLKLSGSPRCLEVTELISSTVCPEHCLVPVQLGLVLRGTSAQFSMICLPTSEDLRQFHQDATYGGPLEPIHKPQGAKTKNKKTVNEYTTPPEVTTVVKSASRDIIGFIKDGSFSFGTGHGFGLGFVALFALQELVEHDFEGPGTTPVLVRANNSQQYRFAHLSVAAS